MTEFKDVLKCYRIAILVKYSNLLLATTSFGGRASKEPKKIQAFRMVHVEVAEQTVVCQFPLHVAAS